MVIVSSYGVKYRYQVKLYQLLSSEAKELLAILVETNHEGMIESLKAE
jgi:hypothetical protein